MPRTIIRWIRDGGLRGLTVTQTPAGVQPAPFATRVLAGGMQDPYCICRHGGDQEIGSGQRSACREAQLQAVMLQRPVDDHKRAGVVARGNLPPLMVKLAHQLRIRPWRAGPPLARLASRRRPLNSCFTPHAGPPPTPGARQVRRRWTSPISLAGALPAAPALRLA